MSEKEIVPLTGRSLIALPEFKPGWYPDLTSEIYHADKTAVNSSSLKLFQKSAATFHAGFFGGFHREPTQAMKLGTLFHMALLEPKKFEESFVRVPKFVGLTKDGKESALSSEAKMKKVEWYNSLAPGTVPVTDAEYEMVHGMLNSVLRHSDASQLMKQGQAEVSGYYSDPATGIRCRIRPDLFNAEMMALVDVKTTQDCSEKAFSKYLWDYRADMQLAMYCEGIEIITGKKVEYPIFLSIEREPPFEICIYVADLDLLRKGSLDYHLALNSLKACIDSGEWNPYQRSAQTIGLPIWAFRE